MPQSLEEFFLKIKPKHKRAKVGNQKKKQRNK
jgi:hypothetical protein